MIRLSPVCLVEGCALTELKGLMIALLRAFFPRADLQIRFRPSFVFSVYRTFGRSGYRFFRVGICLASFTAAMIAKTPPMKTGFQSWKLSKGLYIMPVLFGFTPLLSGNPLQALEIFFFALFGLYAGAAAFEGFMERPIKLLHRALSGVAGILLLVPSDTIRVIGLILFALLFLLQYKSSPGISTTNAG